MPFVKVNGVRINYVQIPCESDSNCEDLVMVHGLAANLAFWYFSHAPAFSKRYRVTLYDLRGHGLSGIAARGYSAENMALDLEQLLGQIGIQQAHFVAHSFGGTIALHLACQHPEKVSSLMLLDTHIYAMRRVRNAEWKYGDRIKAILARNNLDVDVTDPYFGFRLLTEAARLKVRNAEISPELEDLVGPLLGRNSKRTASQWLKLIETTSAGAELMSDDGISPDRLRDLHFPILCVYGEHSQAMSTGERLLEVWPHADFCRIRHAGHFFPATRRADFMTACRGFWDRSLPGEVRNRATEAGKRFFRSDRFYSRGDKFFFDTRETRGNGPFHDLSAAQENLRAALFSS